MARQRTQPVRVQKDDLPRATVRNRTSADLDRLRGKKTSQGNSIPVLMRGSVVVSPRPPKPPEPEPVVRMLAEMMDGMSRMGGDYFPLIEEQARRACVRAKMSPELVDEASAWVAYWNRT